MNQRGGLKKRRPDVFFMLGVSGLEIKPDSYGGEAMRQTMQRTVERGGEFRSGMMIMTAAILTVPGVDALAKLAGGSLSPGEVVWGRFLFQCLFLLPWVIRRRSPGGWFFSRHHLPMGALFAGSVLFLYWGLLYLPLANNIAIFFVEPLILTILSWLFLGEKVSSKTWIAVAVGFVGALIVIRPNWSAYGSAALLPLASGASYAVYLVYNRIYAGKEEAIFLQFGSGFFSTLTLTLALLAGYWADVSVLTPTLPTWTDWILLLSIGFLSAVTQTMITVAFKKTVASVLAPFQYLEIISATILGWLLFSDIPDDMTLLGASIIIGSGLYLFVGESRRSE